MKDKNPSGVEDKLENKVRTSMPLAIASKFFQITDWYFRPRQFEKRGRVYESIGIRKLKDIVRYIGGKREYHKHKKDIYFLSDYSSMALRKFDLASRFFEAFHLVAGNCSAAAGVGVYRSDGDI